MIYAEDHEKIQIFRMLVECIKKGSTHLELVVLGAVSSSEEQGRYIVADTDVIFTPMKDEYGQRENPSVRTDKDNQKQVTGCNLGKWNLNGVCSSSCRIRSR